MDRNVPFKLTSNPIRPTTFHVDITLSSNSEPNQASDVGSAELDTTGKESNRISRTYLWALESPVFTRRIMTTTDKLILPASVLGGTRLFSESSFHSDYVRRVR